ncbi:hypothetical protein ACX80Z_11520 [Arthrobacter sp. TMT4-20]
MKLQRMLGTGRTEDVGDNHVFNDVAIHVPALANMVQAVRSSAADTLKQVRNAANGRLCHSLGRFRRPGARKEWMNWLA